jgi:hypothetical protein
MKKFSNQTQENKTNEVRAMEGISWQLKLLNETMERIATQLEKQGDVK